MVIVERVLAAAAKRLSWLCIALIVAATACGSTQDSAGRTSVEDGSPQQTESVGQVEEVSDEEPSPRQVAGLDVLWNRSLGLECGEFAGEPELAYGAVGWVVLDELPELVGAAEAIDGRPYLFPAVAGFQVDGATQHVGSELTTPVDTIVLRGSLDQAYSDLEAEWTDGLRLVVVYFAPTQAAVDDGLGSSADIGTMKALLVMNDLGDVGIATRDVHHFSCISAKDLAGRVELWVELHELSAEEVGPWFLPEVESTEPDSLATFLLSGGDVEAQRIIIRRQWMARPVNERHFGEQGVPPLSLIHI